MDKSEKEQELVDGRCGEGGGTGHSIFQNTSSKEYGIFVGIPLQPCLEAFVRHWFCLLLPLQINPYGLTSFQYGHDNILSPAYDDICFALTLIYLCVLRLPCTGEFISSLVNQKGETPKLWDSVVGCSK